MKLTEILGEHCIKVNLEAEDRMEAIEELPLLSKQREEAILATLKDGADFMDMVTKYSDDPLAIEKNGDWKEIPIDMMTPDLQNSFDSFSEGEISRPVKTPVGIHIFKIEARQDLTKEEIEDLKKSLSNKRFNEKIEEYSKKLREKAYIKYVKDLAE